METHQRVYVVVGIYQGIPNDLKAFRDGKEARRCGYDLAKEYGLLAKPCDWSDDDGRWDPRRGSRRHWLHHWYNDYSDVFVGESEIL